MTPVDELKAMADARIARIEAAEAEQRLKREMRARREQQYKADRQTQASKRAQESYSKAREALVRKFGKDRGERIGPYSSVYLIPVYGPGWDGQYVLVTIKPSRPGGAGDSSQLQNAIRRLGRFGLSTGSLSKVVHVGAERLAAREYDVRLVDPTDAEIRRTIPRRGPAQNLVISG